MRWDAAEAEAVLERIWDLHDRLSDAILAASRAYLLLPPPPPAPAPSAPSAAAAHRCGGAGAGRNGCVFVKGGGGGGERGAALVAADEAVTEARSLHAIRSALEDLEGHLEFLHTVHSQQLAERDAAIAKLEQSRLVLAMRLAEHQGRKYRVIDEALAFVGEVSDKSRFISPEDVRASHNQSGDNAEDNRGNGSRMMENVLSCSLSLAKNSFRLDKIGGALGNAAVFAVSMLAFLQLHQIAFGSKAPAIEYRKRIEYSFQSGSSQLNGKGKHLEVYLARG
uniref:Plastid division protein PDV1 n=1 Tax=Arundo donax TaxID=35708 RepID=A0A0A9CS89_ARUDO